MNIFQIGTIVVLAIFYMVYIGKMISQRKKGIQTDQIAKGKKHTSVFLIEVIMKCATYGIVLMQLISVMIDWNWMPAGVRYIGFVIALLGDVIFSISVRTMKDSWRAGIPENDKTEMVTEGIYAISRNPAFLGFDLMYIGVMLIYFNPIMIAFTVFAVIMLHLQILSEEKFLPTVFGDEYEEYKKTVFRYLGRNFSNHISRQK